MMNIWDLLYEYIGLDPDCNCNNYNCQSKSCSLYNTLNKLIDMDKWIVEFSENPNEWLAEYEKNKS